MLYLYLVHFLFSFETWYLLLCFLQLLFEFQYCCTVIQIHSEGTWFVLFTTKSPVCIWGKVLFAFPIELLSTITTYDMTHVYFLQKLDFLANYFVASTDLFSFELCALEFKTGFHFLSILLKSGKHKLLLLDQ